MNILCYPGVTKRRELISARAVVHGHEVCPDDGSQNEVYGPNVAGVLGSFALAIATLS